MSINVAVETFRSPFTWWALEFVGLLLYIAETDRSSWTISVKQKPYYKEHHCDRYQQREQVDDDGDCKEHDYQNECYCDEV